MRKTSDVRKRGRTAGEIEFATKPSTVSEAGNVYVRAMRSDDLPAVLAIERAGQRSPWSEAQFRDELEKIDVSRPVVAVKNERIVGFQIVWFVADEVSLNNIGVEPGLRRTGIATVLLKWLCEIGAQEGCRRIHLEVRESNAAAIALYLKAGFQQTGIRRRYYSDTREDAILMTFEFDESVSLH